MNVWHRSLHDARTGAVPWVHGRGRGRDGEREVRVKTGSREGGSVGADRSIVRTGGAFGRGDFRGKFSSFRKVTEFSPGEV